jgi:hypothetical protein
MTIAALGKTSITAGGHVVLNTTLRDSVSGSPISGATVYLLGKIATAKTYSLITHTTTGSTGTAVATVTPTHKTSYLWYFIGSGQNATTASGLKTVSVKQTVTAKLQHNTIRRGKTAVIYGQTNPADAGVKVTLQQLKKGKWHSAGATAKTKKQKLPNGKKVVGFILKAKATGRGTYVLRVVASATKNDSQGVSSKKSLIVS